MSESRWSRAALNELVEAYRGAASVHGRASTTGDYRRANAEADVIAAVYRELRARDAREVLLPLVDDEDEGVRGWAAAHALEFAPAAGEQALESLSTGAGPLAFSATMTLREWREGRLVFP